MKTTAKNILWLYHELPQWTKNGFITDAGGAALHRYYGKPQERHLAQIILAILGALLMGGGIILIVAFNWDEIPRFVKIGGAFSLLMLAQTLTFYAFIRQKGQALKECISLLTSIFLLMAIALIGQLYHTGGTILDLTFWWIAGSIPLVWILQINGVYLVAWVLVPACYLMAEDSDFSWQALVIWLLLLPTFILDIKQFIQKGEKQLVVAAGVASTLFTLYSTLFANDVWLPVYPLSLAGIALALSFIPYAQNTYYDKPNPLLWISKLSLLFTVLFCSFYDTLRSSYTDPVFGFPDYTDLLTNNYLFFVAMLPALFVVILGFFGYYYLKKKQYYALSFMAVPFFFALHSATLVPILHSFQLTSPDIIFFFKESMLRDPLGMKYIYATFFTLSAAFLAVVLIFQGEKRKGWGLQTLAVAYVLLIFTIRFFSSFDSLLARGFAMLFIGIAFIVTSIVFVKRSKKLRQGKKNPLSFTSQQGDDHA